MPWLEVHRGGGLLAPNEPPSPLRDPSLIFVWCECFSLAVNVMQKFRMTRATLRRRTTSLWSGWLEIRSASCTEAGLTVRNVSNNLYHRTHGEINDWDTDGVHPEKKHFAIANGSLNGTRHRASTSWHFLHSMLCYHSNETKPVHWLQIRPIVHN